MKNLIFTLIIILITFSCQKAKEELSQIADETQQKVKDKTSEIIKEEVNKKVNETINNLTNAQDVAFSEVFVNNKIAILDSVKGKSIALPTGSKAIVFKYTSSKNELIENLENQPTENESKSDKKAQKIDGKMMIEKLKLIKNFLPKNIVESSFYNELENNKTLEFYRVNKFPLQSTLIFNPKNSTFYHFVEVNEI